MSSNNNKYIGQTSRFRAGDQVSGQVFGRCSAGRESGKHRKISAQRLLSYDAAGASSKAHQTAADSMAGEDGIFTGVDPVQDSTVARGEGPSVCMI